MDAGNSFHWAAHRPAEAGEALLVYADGGCRVRHQRGKGPASSASVMLAWAPGARMARLLQVSAIFWPEATAAEAEVSAAGLAACAVNCAPAESELCRPAFVPGVSDLDIDPILHQLRTEYFYQGVSVAGKFVT